MAKDPFYYDATRGALWVQPDGPNTETYFLGCHALDGPEIPEGDGSLRFCPDEGATGKYKRRALVRGEPDAPSFSITTGVGRVLDYLETWECDGNILHLKQSQGRRDQRSNWERGQIYAEAMRTGRTYSNMLSRTPDAKDDSQVEIPFQCLDVYDLVRLRGVRQTVTGAQNALVIAFCQDSQCQNGGPRVRRCQYGLFAGEGAVAAPAVFELTADGGVTWTPVAADPFANNQDIGAAVYLPWEPGVRRIIAALSTATAAAAVIAYSDDEAATWTTVMVGAVVGQYITSIYALDRYHIWVGTDDGYIYFSGDGGATWAAQEAGVIAATAYNDIRFLDSLQGVAVSLANVMATTVNGGRTWTAVVGPAPGDNLLTVELVTANRWFVGTDAGDLHYTEDAGANWALRAFAGSGAGEVRQIRFENEMVGMMVHDTAVPVGRFFRTLDGGWSWEQEAVPANDGLSDVVSCGVNHAYVVGNLSGTTAYVAEVASI